MHIPNENESNHADKIPELSFNNPYKLDCNLIFK